MAQNDPARDNLRRVFAGMGASMGFSLAVCAEMVWTDRPIEWRVACLHERGFGIGLWNVTDHDQTKLAATGARFSIMNGFLQGGLTDLDSAHALLESAEQMARIGRSLGVERLNLLGQSMGPNGGPAQPVPELTEAMEQMALQTLRRVADLADRLQVTFTLENLNTLVDHPGMPFARAEQTLALVSAVNHPRLRLNLDLYHAQIGEGNLTQLCQRALPWIGEIQVADVPGRHEPGTGEVNWRHLALALNQMGYHGPITMEARPKGNVDQALEAFRHAFTL